MRPWQGCLERKRFSLDFTSGAAELFTEACGELLGALLALGGITLETVSGAKPQPKLSQENTELFSVL
jgi:hypothetical protein